MIDRPKEYRFTVSPLVQADQRETVYFVVDRDAPFLWRGFKLEYNQVFPGVDGGFSFQFFDNEGYSPTDRPISCNLMPNCYAWFNYPVPVLANLNGAGQMPALWNPQILIPAGGRIGVRVEAGENAWIGSTGLLKFTFVGVKRYQ